MKKFKNSFKEFIFILRYAFNVILLLLIIKVGYLFELDDYTDEKINDLFESVIKDIDFKILKHSKFKKILKKTVYTFYR